MPICVHYQPGGEPIEDFSLDGIFENWVDGLEQIKQGDDPGFIWHVYVSTSNIISRVRLGIVRGEISPEDIWFNFNGQDIRANKYGAITNWPSGFADIECSLAEEILVTATKQRREDRKSK